MRRYGVRAAAALVLLAAGCGARVPGGGAVAPGGGTVRGGSAQSAQSAAAAAGSTTMPLESQPIVLRCADAARGIAPPSPSFLHVEGLASDGWDPLPALPEIGPVSAGGRPYRFVTAFLYVTPQAAPLTTLSVVSPAAAWLYYTDFGTWTAGRNPLAAPVPHGPSKQLQVAACPDRGTPTGYLGGVLLAGPACVTLRFTRSDTRASRTATFRYGVRSC